MLDLRVKWSADRKIFLIGYAVTSHYVNKQYLLSWQDFFLDMSLHISIIERTVPCQHFIELASKEYDLISADLSRDLRCLLGDRLVILSFSLSNHLTSYI